jgi:hypothetical protein
MPPRTVTKEAGGVWACLRKEAPGATAITYEGCGPCGPRHGRRSSSGCHGGRRHATVVEGGGGGTVIKEEGHGQQGSAVRSWRLAVLCFL